MAQEFKLPDLGEGTYEAEIQEILIEAGDEVDEGETIMTVETDKATMDVPSPYTGRISSVHVESGEIARVGDLLVTFGDGETESDAGPEEEEEEEEAEQEEQAAPETKEETEEAERAAEEAEQPAGGAAGGNGDRPVPAAPATRRLARELEVDLRAVEGSGPAGRVTREDVRDAAERGEQKEASPEEADEREAPEREEAPVRRAAPRPELPDFSRWGDVERTPLRSVRRTTARRMAQSWSRIPHVSHHDAADITELNQLLEKEEELDLTVTLFAMKAAVAALRQFPRFNASLDMENEALILKHYYHIGAAVDTDRGLIVPVIRDVDRKSIAMLSDEFGELVQRTRDGDVSLEELQGGTFTITNVGPLGGTHFTPIINYPQVAILGLARAAWRPVVRDTEKEPAEMSIEPRLMLPLVLGFDHRVVDGADAARFMNLVVDTLENPQQLLLHA
jgi:pyruvate dehydrogenase E2 component (dihydrolipoamide acetyltransferase)